jgi:hypothetical protein
MMYDSTDEGEKNAVVALAPPLVAHVDTVDLALTELSEEGCDALAEDKRVELDLEDGVELRDDLGGAAEDVAHEGVGEEGRARGGLGEAEEGGEARCGGVCVRGGGSGGGVLGGEGGGEEPEGDGEGGDEDLAREARGVFRGRGLGFSGGGGGGGGLSCPLHAGFASRAGGGEEVVQALHGTECLLPELELDGGVELREARVEVVLEGYATLERCRRRVS